MHNWNAEDYNKHSSVQLEWARQIIPCLKLRGDERVLDVGCGDGKITAEIGGLLPNGSIHGVDKSEAMISFAQEAFPTGSVPNLSFEVMDASDLRFDSQFDLIISFACLHWVKDHGPVLRGMKRSLKPTGRIFMQCGGRGNADAVSEVIGEMISSPKWNRYFEGFESPYGFYGPEEYRQWLVEAGLTPVRVELIPKDNTQQGKDGLLGWLRTTWFPFTDRLPEDQRPAFLSELADRYIEGHPVDEAGRVVVKMMRLEVEAENSE